jgi:hypothetical protein
MDYFLTTGTQNEKIPRNVTRLNIVGPVNIGDKIKGLNHVTDVIFWEYIVKEKNIKFPLNTKRITGTIKFDQDQNQTQDQGQFNISDLEELRLIDLYVYSDKVFIISIYDCFNLKNIKIIEHDHQHKENFALYLRELSLDHLVVPCN